ncbi:MAG TPA: hypothetical protein VMT32_03265 [Bryobacteraceae bacterium]|nr:hypothetical protein [Bryobacteraceae bacterium]
MNGKRKKDADFTGRSAAEPLQRWMRPVRQWEVWAYSDSLA